MSEKPHILVVIATLHRGGAERVLSRLTHQWAHTHAITIAVFDGRKQAYPVAATIHDLKSYDSAHIIVKFWRQITRVISLTRLIRQTRPTHLIGFMEYSNFPLICAALITGNLAKTQVSVRASPQYMAAFLPRHIYFVYRLASVLLYRLPKRVIAVSSGVKQELADMGVPPAKLAFIPNPAPVTSHKKSLSHPKPAIAKYILAAGRLHPQKGFDLLLRAYAGLATPTPDLVILGEDIDGRRGATHQSLVKLAKALGIAARVHFMGAVKNPEYWYANAELFVLSSRYEGWPNVLMEAMHYGCAAVSFACPTGPDEIITHRKTGLLVKNGDVAGLTRAIATLLGDAKLRLTLASHGQRRVQAFDIAKLAPQWIA